MTGSAVSLTCPCTLPIISQQGAIDRSYFTTQLGRATADHWPGHQNTPIAQQLIDRKVDLSWTSYDFLCNPCRQNWDYHTQKYNCPENCFSLLVCSVVLPNVGEYLTQLFTDKFTNFFLPMFKNNLIIEIQALFVPFCDPSFLLSRKVVAGAKVEKPSFSQSASATSTSCWPALSCAC